MHVPQQTGVCCRSRVSVAWFAILLICLPATEARAGWTDKFQGTPVLEFFPSQQIGASEMTWSPVQDSRGRLFVGGNSLLVFDGAEWKSYPLPDAYALRALALGPDGRLWAGAYKQLGYYRETSDGRFEFTSLLPHLTDDQRDFNDVWGCGMVDDQVFFVCQSTVLRWDGKKFTEWNFPTAARLYPVRCGGELWFTHSETGLYRLTRDGPHLEFNLEQLPARAAFGLERTMSGLLHISRAGMYYLSEPQKQVASAEVVDFLRTNPICSACRLPDGNFAIGTFGGLLFVSPDGRLLRRFSQDDGLPTNAIAVLFLDQEKRLWVTSSAGGITRLDPSAAVTIFRQWQQADHASVTRLLDHRGIVLAATDGALYQLQTSPESRSSRFEPVPHTPSVIFDTVSHQGGLLLARFDEVEFYDGASSHPVLNGGLGRLRPSKLHSGMFYGLHDRTVIRISQNASGGLESQSIGQLQDDAGDFYVDTRDNLWLDSGRAGVWYFDTASRQLTNVHPGEKTGIPTELSQVSGHGHRVYFFATREAWVANDLTRESHRVATFPDVTALQCIASPGGRWLYVVFKRKRDAGTNVYGLGRFSLDAEGEPGAWQELRVPRLEAAGTPSCLLVTNEDGPDALWVGGSEGVLRIKPDELPRVAPPAAPWLHIYNTTGPADMRSRLPSYPFGRHHLLIQAGTPEIDQRKDLWFQSRFGANAEWSAPSPRNVFEFTNLTDSDYHFEVRVVNAAGLTSAPFAYAFRILPPWYRTNWAFGGYAAALALGVFGLIRFRERVIRERNRQLEALVTDRTAELVKANAAKDEFLAGISHEIRNPMNGVVGLASTFDTSRLDDLGRQRVEYLRHCATHLSGLLEDILDFSRLQAGAVTLNPQPFDLPEMMRSIAAITSAESTKAGIPVEIAVSPAVPARLVGDVARIRQILLNYVINALKYSGRGTVCITVWCRRHEQGKHEITFAVSDDGPGIAAEEQARLFTRFERGAAARQGRVSGTGLGLAMCKTLAEKMGGRLWVESEVGRGSTFYFSVTLPAEPPSRSIAAGPEEAGRPPAVPAGTLALHALVVDDEDYNRLALSAFLEQAGFQVATARDAETALAAARSQPFHAVFLDLSLPGESGLEIARQIRALPGVSPAMPIIATTAYTTKEKRNQCLSAGMNAFLTKPVSLEKIRAALMAATAAFSASAPLHPPGDPDTATDPLATLRLLASRKGVPLSAELDLYFTELESEARLLADALQARDSATTAQAAHKLTGRLAYVNSDTTLTRELEAAATNESWDEADFASRRLVQQLISLREQFKTIG
jgi:signal transduction histidine kinase/CheY-like chemotaxis protein/ligand-binding sensor domain-containing protein